MFKEGAEPPVTDAADVNASGTLDVDSGDVYIKYRGGGSGSGSGGYLGWDCTASSTIEVSGGTIHVCGQSDPTSSARLLDWNPSQSHTWTGGTLSLELGSTTQPH